MGKPQNIEGAMSVWNDWAPFEGESVFYRPEKFSDLSYDGARIYELLNSCDVEICYVGLWSSNESYLAEAIIIACSDFNHLTPSKRTIKVLIIGSAGSKDAYARAAEGCFKYEFRSR